MGLKISLKPKERLVINSAVISNAGNSECSLSVENNATILRENNIMSEKDATTPCKQLYFIIQLMYIDGENIPYHHKAYSKLVDDILQAAPSTRPFLDDIKQHTSNEKHYLALKASKKLIDFEQGLFASKKSVG
jgi:flagellar biosynthesis repressor protein FlbT